MILVSACLADMRTRYDGDSLPDDEIRRLVIMGQALPVCPEILGGLAIPREPAEISVGGGWGVIEGKTRVYDVDGVDVTAAFIRGAVRVLALARAIGAKKAVLKSNSPSCGSGKRNDDGVTAAILKKNGIEVISEIQFKESKGENRD